MRNLLVAKVASTETVKKVAELRGQNISCKITGLSQSSKSVFFAALRELCGKGGSLVIITAGREDIRAYRRELNFFFPQLPMQELYPVSVPRVQAETMSLELQAGRSAALRFMSGEQPGVVFITAEALQQKQSASSATGECLNITLGDECEQRRITEYLLTSGYERTEQVDALGQFCLRGDIMDVFPINSSNPVRIEWFDNCIDAVRTFSINDQRSLAAVESVKIAPIVAEAGEEYTASVFDCCSSETLVFMDEPAKVFDMLEKLSKENRQYAAELFTPAEIAELCAERSTQSVSALPHSYMPQLQSVTVPCRNTAPYNRKTELFAEDAAEWLREGVTPLVMLSNSVKARAFAENLHNYGLPAVYAEGRLQAGTVNVGFGELDHGFRFAEENWLLITENDLFGMQKRKRLPQKNKGMRLEYFSDIKAGDYVVHRVHGIGRYIGVESVVVDGIRREYLLLAYAGSDKLYVPADQVGALHKYVGGDGAAPRLSKMGGSDWQRTTAKAAKAITELAEELLRLYAKRQIMPGFAFSPDTEMQREFEAAFPYEETPDQLKAIAEIKADMEKARPMERLLCGDVGYGKTEVALRAAFKAVLDGKQVAVMVPTTVLAQQHFLTFRERLRNFGVNVEMATRFNAGKEQKRILNSVTDGTTDILVGTHRILQADVQFHDLGLLIIDEEQRFGVAQKEKIKQWRTGIDVLSLSATPIPRTLHMALVSSRDMSVIESPPEDRLPVETFVCEYNDSMIKEALERELRRGGRIYYVHNRIGGLDAIAGRLRKLVPGINIKVAHGRMSEELLEDAMISFYEGECDVLLSTTIVENGLDVPLANTVIVDGAENFGLSQLYQIRGRVGRSSRLAYAYFVYRPGKALTEIAQKRLEAIRDFTELGAGFKIAMRDLEIRGAGNLLGPQQHGHISGIGFGAYCNMLEKTIARLRNKDSAIVEEYEPVLELSLEAYIPDEYIASPRYKMELYRRFAELEYSRRDDLLDEIIDRFGDPPQEVQDLWRVASLKSLCRLLGIRGITIRSGNVRITFGERATVDREKFVELLQKSKGALTYRDGSNPQLLYKFKGENMDALLWLERNLPDLAVQSV